MAVNLGRLEDYVRRLRFMDKWQYPILPAVLLVRLLESPAADLALESAPIVRIAYIRYPLGNLILQPGLKAI